MVHVAPVTNPHATSLTLSNSSPHSNGAHSHWVEDSHTLSEDPSFGIVKIPTNPTSTSKSSRPRVASIPSFVSSTRGSGPMPAPLSMEPD